MPAIGIGLGIPFNRRLSYPTTGLDTIVYFNSTYEDGGTTYVRTSKGTGLPVISGTGLDRIIDFSGLNDVRFDKGAYVGNSYGLPETYNYPYVGIYYDATNEATRYYWKPTDFAYAVILAQSLLVDNMFFLKATATTNTSNIITTVDRLFIYSTALADNNLAKMKTYIGIQDDFYGDDLLFGWKFNNWAKIGSITINSSIKFTSINAGGLQKSKILIGGKTYQFIISGNTTASSVNLTSSTSGVAYFTGLTGSFTKNEVKTINNLSTDLYWRNSGSGETTINIQEIKQFYQNYYKS